MKISYIFQLKDASIMFICGIIIGIIYGILNIANFIKSRLYTQIISDIIFSIISVVLYIILINQINSGEIRIYLLLSYILGFFIERITLGKLFAKGYKNVYNYIVKVFKKFTKSKFGRLIFK